ncbi:MAG TPA: hypothetical protein VJ828_16280, partial [Lacipirellulaceae bacterium]|nr:hypothetical protein [Lacipirellulaceae bacterium]
MHFLRFSLAFLVCAQAAALAQERQSADSMPRPSLESRNGQPESRGRRREADSRDGDESAARGRRAAAGADDSVKANYTKYEYMIPMRDGVRLFTAVYVPKDTSEDHPILMVRTPY